MSGTTLTASTPTNKAFSGRIDPGFSSQVMSIMVNPFIKFHGFEVFATYEMSNGNASLSNVLDSVDRSFNKLQQLSFISFPSRRTMLC
ncbi:MAG: hypothetical protein IPL12_22890 [Bacteroidetes bacterium]|nr:hypothetical protein [Bacteroidota bacterium]